MGNGTAHNATLAGAAAGGEEGQWSTGVRWLVGMAMLLPIVAMNVRGIGAARRAGAPAVLCCRLLPFNRDAPCIGARGEA